MTRSFNRATYRFADDLPVMGGIVGNLSVASSGQIGGGGPFHYVLIAYTNVATTGLSKHLFRKPDRESEASGQPMLDIYEVRLPIIDDFRFWREEENLARVLTKEDRARRHINTFLAEVYSLSQIGDTDTAGYKIFDFLDRVLCDGFFAVCDDVLSMVDVEKLDTKLMRSFLSITASAKKTLPARAALYKKIENRMIELRGEVKTRKIIGNLA